jgi:glucose/arabinose dehydrogenase
MVHKMAEKNYIYKMNTFIRLLLISSLYAFELSAQPPLQLKTIEVAGGFTSPVGLAAPPDGTNRLFIIEQGGKIKIIKNGITLPVPFLQITHLLDGLNIAYSEKGLLGFAFHPAYRGNGKFYVHYSAKTDESGMDHKSVIAEYRTDRTNPDKADVSSARIVLEVQQPESNHNGGQLAFGPDGFLYIGFGDGGGAGDKHSEEGNGQNPRTLLGKIIRIDVNTDEGYKIPEDNPFIRSGMYRHEIWATGLRNPWRFSFDKGTGKLYCADVGQNKYEEINIIEKGRNYGWRIMEGNHCFNPETGCNTDKLTLPIAEYEHSEGVSVIGGYMYRGNEFPSLHGYYFFGDWTGKVWYLRQEGQSWQRGPVNIRKNTNEADGKINSFGEDQEGNIYIVTQKLFGPKSPTGVIYKLSY